MAYAGLFDMGKAGVSIHKMPMSQVLEQGQDYTFSFSFPGNLSLALVDSNHKWTFLTSGSDITVNTGTLTEIGLYFKDKNDSSTTSYSSAFTYKIERDVIFEYEAVARTANIQTLNQQYMADRQAAVAQVTGYTAAIALRLCIFSDTRYRRSSLRIQKLAITAIMELSEKPIPLTAPPIPSSIGYIQ